MDGLGKIAEDYKVFNLSIEKYLDRYYIERLGAQVFGHYNPAGNFWLAYAIRKELINRLNPKPPAYR